MLKSPEQSGGLSQFVAQRENYRKAINFSGSIRNRERRCNYLLEKAQNFLFQKQYDHAAMVAWHILYRIDTHSIQARHILRSAYTHIFSPRV